MKQKKFCGIITCLVIFIQVYGTRLYSSPYTLSPVTDGILLSSGTALCGLSIYTDKKIRPLTAEDISTLSKNDINSFDRSAADNWSPTADKWSDVILTSIMISPAALLFDAGIQKDSLTVGVMYAESLLITRGASGTTKNIVQRNRPYTYNSRVPYRDKMDKDAVRSFYSGHTVNAFNTAVFTGTVFSDYYPESPWRYAVWGAGLSAASLTGYLRYRSGMHYPSDILAGALIGSATGFLVPLLHRYNSENISIQVIPGTENKAAVTLNF